MSNNSLYKGSNSISKVYKGSTLITKIYKGSTLINYNQNVIPSICYITNELYGITLTNSATYVNGGSSYTTDLTTTQGEYIQAFMVIMGNEDITGSVYYKSSKFVQIPEVTGDIELIGNAPSNATSTSVYYVVRQRLTNVTTSDSTVFYKKNEYINITLTPDIYKTFTNIKVTVDGVDKTSSVLNSYDDGTKAVKIFQAFGNVLIIAEAQ